MRVHTRVAVPGVDMLVSEQLRNLTQVGAGGQELGDKDVPERIRLSALALCHAGGVALGPKRKARVRPDTAVVAGRRLVAMPTPI
jgi:hypothetical protein